MNYGETSHAWDFKLAHDLSEAFKASLVLTIEEISTGLPSNPYDPKSSESQSLGDLNRLFTYLGKPTHDITSPKRNHISCESSSSLSDHSTTPSSIAEGVEHFDDFIAKAKGVRWKDEVAGTNLTEPRRNAFVSGKELDATVIARLLEDDAGLNLEHQADGLTQSKTGSQLKSSAAIGSTVRRGVGSDSELRQRGQTSSKSSIQKRPSSPDPSADEFEVSALKKATNRLLPASIFPHPVRSKAVDDDLLYLPSPIPQSYIDPTVIQPKFTLTIEEKRVKLCKKLRKKFNDAPNSLMGTDIINALTNWGGNESKEGIHVFVDCSNITIGFYNALKLSRNMSISSRIKTPPISYHSLALICKEIRNAPSQSIS